MVKILVCYRRMGCLNARLRYKEIEVGNLEDVWSDIYFEIDEDYTVLGYTVITE